jgi:DNA processing protein
MSEHQQIIAALTLSRRPFVGASLFRRLVSQYGSPIEALEALPEVLQREPFNHAQSRHKAETVEGLGRAEEFLHRGGKALYFGGPEYPAALHSLGEPPPVLFVRGSLAVLHRSLLAIVGTRHPDEAGQRATEDCAIAAARSGFGVVSGGARGVDSAAHLAALAVGAVTVAVLGCGVDVAYPPENRSLFDAILVQGAIVSEIFPGTQPNKGFFLTRNRIIAGLAKATLVTRAGFRSGAITTATWARRLERPVGVLPVDESDPLGEASRILQKRGARLLAAPSEVSSWCVGLPHEVGFSLR